MDRREFLKCATTCCGLLAVPQFAWPEEAAGASESISFYLAGVRFYRVQTGLQDGNPVIIGSSSFDGKRCHPVYDVDGRQLGFVPKQFVPIVGRSKICRSYLSLVDPCAVPWKRYEVTLLVSAQRD